MGEGRAKAQAQALLLAALLVMSCSAAASPSNCIPRRLLMAASGSYYQRPPCNDDDPIHRRPTPSGSDDGPQAQARGYRTPGWGPPPPTSGTVRAKNEPRPPPGSIN